MNLNHQLLGKISKGKTEIPQHSIFALPEKILQFGTGVLVRGLPDYFVDKANKLGIFNGRIVMVKSTETGDASAFARQDCLYTTCIRGIEEGRSLEQNIINASISRVLSAASQWKEIIACAHNRDMQIVISNTTEVGIQLSDDSIHDQPPASYPGKLLAFLYERYQALGRSPGSGMVIVPTELIPENGFKLKSIVMKLAGQNELGPGFQEWLEQHNQFCNSLVDRIVPGRPQGKMKTELEAQLGYSDDLMILCEEYRLWAIEGNEKVREILSFAQADPGVIIAPDISMYRELKLRLLNGVHTLSSGLAFLSGLDTVKQAMNTNWMAAYIQHLMLNEIAPAIPYPVQPQESRQFGNKVLDRFRNPYLEHQWLSITMQYSSKMRLRNVPVLLRHYELYHTPPHLIAAGFAAFLLFMKAEYEHEGKYFGVCNGKPYPIQDNHAGWFFQKWKEIPVSEIVDVFLASQELWGHDLSGLPGFAPEVKRYMMEMMEMGVETTIRRLEQLHNV